MVQVAVVHELELAGLVEDLAVAEDVEDAQLRRRAQAEEVMEAVELLGADDRLVPADHLGDDDGLFSLASHASAAGLELHEAAAEVVGAELRQRLGAELPQQGRREVSGARRVGIDRAPIGHRTQHALVVDRDRGAEAPRGFGAKASQIDDATDRDEVEPARFARGRDDVAAEGRAGLEAPDVARAEEHLSAMLEVEARVAAGRRETRDHHVEGLAASRVAIDHLLQLGIGVGRLGHETLRRGMRRGRLGPDSMAHGAGHMAGAFEGVRGASKPKHPPRQLEVEAKRVRDIDRTRRIEVRDRVEQPRGRLAQPVERRLGGVGEGVGVMI